MATGLGRGLEALIPKKKDLTAPTSTTPASGSESIIKISLHSIKANPEQPRQHFDPNELNKLANSIKKHGILQPLVVTRLGEDQYQLIVGERRMRAAKQIGLTEVPVIIRDSGQQEKLELALVENLQRANLNPLEEARAYARLQAEFDLTQEEIAKRVDKSRAAITNYLRLLELPSEAQEAMLQNRLSAGHAKALLMIKSPTKQQEVLREILDRKLSVRQVETLARSIQVKEHRRTSPRAKNPQLIEFEEGLQKKLSTRVKISERSGKGKIIIEYFSEEERQGLRQKLLGE